MNTQKKFIGGVLIAGGVSVGAGLLIWYFVRKSKDDKKKVSVAFDTFNGMIVDGETVSDVPTCMLSCASDPKCTGYSTNNNTHKCSMTQKDPYTASIPNADWTLSIKRAPGAKPSTWSEWAPVPCPADKKQTRQCMGVKCPSNGALSRDCTPVVPTAYDEFAGLTFST